MAAHAIAKKDGVELLAPRTFCALHQTAAIMARPVIKTNSMAANATALKVGVETHVEPTSLAMPTMIAVATVRLRIKTKLMVAIASATLDGKVTAVMLR